MRARLCLQADVCAATPEVEDGLKCCWQVLDRFQAVCPSSREVFGMQALLLLLLVVVAVAGHVVGRPSWGDMGLTKAIVESCPSCCCCWLWRLVAELARAGVGHAGVSGLVAVE